MVECKVFLENQNGVYHPGDEIKGRLEYYVGKENNIQNIIIDLGFYENNEWTVSDEDGKTTLKGRFFSVLFTQKFLHGTTSTRSLTRANHIGKFSYILPQGIPSSYLGPYGGVTYKIVGVVEVSPAQRYEDTLKFTVDCPIDFNHLPTPSQDRAIYSKDKTICCCWCQGGEIAAIIELLQQQYTPGEVITCKVDVSNWSSTNIKAFRATVTKTIVYTVNNPEKQTKSFKEIIAKVEEHGVGAHGEHTYYLELPIPEDTIVENFSKCRFFDVFYRLQITCVLPSCHHNLDVLIDHIVLGHIRRRNQANVSSGNPSNVTPDFIDLSPPPYQEASSG